MMWIEYDYQLFYTRGWKQAMDCGTRQITAASMDINMMLNAVIGRFDHKKIVELGERLVVQAQRGQADAHHQLPAEPISDLCTCEGRLCNQSGTYAAPGTSVMLSGQTSMCPIEETINGTINVPDGGLLPRPRRSAARVNPVKLTIEKGVCTKIEGPAVRRTCSRSGWPAGTIPRCIGWRISPCGFNPGVPEPTGRIEEDERIFGCVEIGLGTQGEGPGRQELGGCQPHRRASFSTPPSTATARPLRRTASMSTPSAFASAASWAWPVTKSADGCCEGADRAGRCPLLTHCLQSLNEQIAIPSAEGTPAPGALRQRGGCQALEHILGLASGWGFV
ncbi:MAG: hypothetical protein ACLU9S_05025 [Oscillospiraceae bacterium]